MLRFSRINESMGSLAGDELLITFARRLILALRAGDILARTGGNEFGVLVSLRRGVEDALKAAERIQEVMATPFKISDLEIRVECAIGAGADACRAGLARSCSATPSSRSSRPSSPARPQVYEPKQATEARRRFSIETELRRALDKDQLKLFYQPLINLKTGRRRGLRGARPLEPRGPRRDQPDRIHSGRRGIGPDPAARPLGDGQGRADPRRMGQARPARSCRSTSASISRRSRSRATTSPPSSRARCKSSGLTGDRLTLELTESSIVQDPARATRVFDALKALDATVAMDDFGTGYSSLAYLQRLPIDVLKIDRSFVSGMMVDPDSVAIVRAVLSLAEALGMSTTAEGIETVELATTLATLGCASGQGFYFAKPLEADDGARILEVAPPLSRPDCPGTSGSLELPPQQAG